MRTLKFRAWNEYSKEYDWTLAIKTGNGIVELSKFFELPNMTIEQFTGFKDRNGKEVYEGDVIRYKVLRDDCSTRHGYKYREVIEAVEYDDGRGMYIIGQYSPLGTIVDHYEPEVIGNVHENPELLGGEE